MSLLNIESCRIKNAYSKVYENDSSSSKNDTRRIYAYHCTETNPYDIIKYGFDSSKGNEGFTNENQFEFLYENYLPENPCFISKRPWNSVSSHILKIDITGLELYPDFGHLPDLGAYYEEPYNNGDTLFWWETKEYTHPKGKLSCWNSLRNYLIKHDGYLHSENFTGEMSWDFIDTACIDGNDLTPDRIVEIDGEPCDDSTIHESICCAEVETKCNDVSQKINDTNNTIVESVYDDYNVDTLNIIEEFKDDTERHILKKQWNLIDPEQYAYALSKFVDEGPELFRFSESVIDKWLALVIENTKEIDAIGVLDGRDELNGGACIDYYMIEEEFPIEFEKEYKKYKEYSEKSGLGNSWARINAAMATLDDVGFYDWARLPDGNPADTDNGVVEVREILENIDEDASISDKLVAINRCLDVFHRRSDWASAFIKGGRASLDKIASSRRTIASKYEPENESVETNRKWIHDNGFNNILRKKKLDKLMSMMSFDGDDGPVFLREDFFKTILPSEFYINQVKSTSGNIDDFSSVNNQFIFELTINLKNTKGYGDKNVLDKLNFVIKNNAAVDFGDFISDIWVVWNSPERIKGKLTIKDSDMLSAIRKRKAEPYEQYKVSQATLEL